MRQFAGDNFIPTLHLRQPEFTYIASCTPTKHREKIENFKETSDLNSIYQNERDKFCFALDASNADS